MVTGAVTPAIRITNISKFFGQLIAIDDVTIDIAAGEFLVIVGPSGCGKTTLLRILAGLEQPSVGAFKVTTPKGLGRPENAMVKAIRCSPG